MRPLLRTHPGLLSWSPPAECVQGILRPIKSFSNQEIYAPSLLMRITAKRAGEGHGLAVGSRPAGILVSQKKRPGDCSPGHNYSSFHWVGMGPEAHPIALGYLTASMIVCRPSGNSLGTQPFWYA
jgi:hypothetical protein